MRVLSVCMKTDVWKQCVGSVYGTRTEKMQKIEKNVNSLAAVIHKNKRNAVSNSEKVVHSEPQDC